MKSGLEEFLKRIEAKPTNETLIDRFMTLVLEEEGVDRILGLKSLVGLLITNNPYAALKAAYVELQEARKEKLHHEYEIGALKDVESCFLTLGKAENAAIIREEISKLQSDFAKAKGIASAKAAASPMPSVPPAAQSLPSPTALPRKESPLEKGLPVSAAADSAPSGSAAQAFFASLTHKGKGGKPLAPEPPQAAPSPLFAEGLALEAKDQGFRLDESFYAHDESTNPSGLAKSPADENSEAKVKAQIEIEAKLRVETEDLARMKAQGNRSLPNGIPNAADEVSRLFSGTVPTKTTAKAPLPASAIASDSLPTREAPQKIALAKSESEARLEPDTDSPSFTEKLMPRTSVKGAILVDKIKDDQSESGGFAPLSTSVAVGLPQMTRPAPAPSFNNEVTSVRPGSFMLEDEESPADLSTQNRFTAISFKTSQAPSRGSQNTVESPDATEGDEGEFALSFEYTKGNRKTPEPSKGPALEAANHQPSVASSVSAQAETPISLKRVEEKSRIVRPSNIDESYEAQPFFQPDEDEVENDAAPAEPTLSISLEKLDETREQIDLATSSSAKVQHVRIPINSGPNFVVLDDDDNEVTKIEAPIYADDEEARSEEPTSALPKGPLDSGFEPSELSMPGELSDFFPPSDPGLPAAHSNPLDVRSEGPSENSLVEARKMGVIDLDPDRVEPSDLRQEPTSHEPPKVVSIAEFVTGIAKADWSTRPQWALFKDRLTGLAGFTGHRAQLSDFTKKLLQSKTDTPRVLKVIHILTQFIDREDVDEASASEVSTWLFEELEPGSLHELFISIQMKDELLELYLDHIESLRKRHAHRLALSVMHDILRFELEEVWYVRSYPLLRSLWEKLGLEAWNWLPYEGGLVFCDRLARREEPMLATLLA